MVATRRQLRSNHDKSYGSRVCRLLVFPFNQYVFLFASLGLRIGILYLRAFPVFLMTCGKCPRLTGTMCMPPHVSLSPTTPMEQTSIRSFMG